MLHMTFFAALYFIQGAALAYIVNFQKPYLAAEGVSKEAIGVFTSALLIPFIAKVFLGMVSDKVPMGRWGSRKPYMFAGLLLFAFCYFQVSRVSPGADFASFAALTWLASLGLALFDTCADGWAVDVAGRQEQSLIQASMIAGKSLGLISMAYVFGQLAGASGYESVFLLLAGMSVPVLAIVLIVPYRPRRHAPGLDPVGAWRDMVSPFYLAFAGFGVVYSLASFGTDGLVTLHFAELRQATAEQIGEYGVARGVGALIGAAVYVPVGRQLGLRRAQYLALLLLGLGALLPLAALPVHAAGALWGFCWAFQETAYVTLAMRFAQGAWAATFFAVAMIFSNVGTAIGEALAAPLVPSLGYGGVFSLFALIAWAAVVFVPLMLRPFSRGRPSQCPDAA